MRGAGGHGRAEEEEDAAKEAAEARESPRPDEQGVKRRERFMSRKILQGC